MTSKLTSARTRPGGLSRVVVALVAVPSALLFAWTLLELVGVDSPPLQLCVDLMVLVVLPLAWAARSLRRRSARAVDAAIRERVRDVITSRSLLTAFQPIVDCHTLTPLGFEALSRFTHLEPQAGPDVWFAEAARVGLGTELELLAARIALETAGELNGLRERVYLSINLSPAAILTGQLAQLLRETGWTPARIVLEITEHSLVADYEALTSAIAPLRLGGLRLAIDDAGAGYASFRHILALDPDYIKLDRSLVSDLDTDPARRALAGAVVTFAADIGATVIAEGVETTGELETLKRLGVSAAQGYLIGRPDSFAAGHGQLGVLAALRPGASHEGAEYELRCARR